jgi:hypothetical protein
MVIEFLHFIFNNHQRYSLIVSSLLNCGTHATNLVGGKAARANTDGHCWVALEMHGGMKVYERTLVALPTADR